MPDVAYIIRTRERKEQRARNSPWGRIGLGCATLLSLFIALTGVFMSFIYGELTHDLPPLEALPLLVDHSDGLLYQPTRFYDRTGEHVLFSLENPAAFDRQYLTLDTSLPNHIPASLITATLAVSDPDFWVHPGISLDVPGSSSPPAAPQSTLAERLVSNLLLWDKPAGLKRTLHERFLAAQVTARYGRERVLTWYLNTANYGRLAFGADAAARVYFGKPAAELTLAESAVLASVSEAPALNPLDAPQAARERQQALLQAMIDEGIISAEQGEASLKENLHFHPNVPVENNLAPAFSRLVLEQLSERIDLARLERGGYRVITTLDYDLQLQAACAAAVQQARLAGQSEEPLAADGRECVTARLLPSIPLKSDTHLDKVASNVIVYDPNLGQVLAMIGGTAVAQNPAYQLGHPAGTSLSPIVYLTAFARGLSPATLVWDIPPSAEITEDGTIYHGPVRMRSALANDYLLSLNNVITQVGFNNVWRNIQQLGLVAVDVSSQSASGLIDQFRTSLLDLSQAYSTFAAQGVLAGEKLQATDSTTPASLADLNGEGRLKPVTILRLEDSLEDSWPVGRSINQVEFVQRPVINPQLAYLITDVLGDETARWPSLGHPNPLEIGRPVAAKIGTTLDGRDAWTIGYTPERLVGVWLGVQDGDAPIPDLPVQSAALWNAIMQHVLQDIPAKSWSVPAGVNRVNVCNPSGLLPSEECPDVVSEVFLAGTEPTQEDSLYQTFQINRETGRLATAFTPPDLIDERVYLIVPPEAEAWARLAGLPTPPDEYDVIQSLDNTSLDVKITSPSMLSHVSDQVKILGSAAGDDFAYYRLQVGSGLNPRTWLQIGGNVTQPVTAGELGVWDTTGLDGLHTIQLQVVRNDQRVDTAVLQVTVDNQAPQVAILSPMDGQEAIPRAGQITILAEVQDNLESQRVEFYLNGDLLETRYQMPYAIPWQSKPGEHTLRVVAFDKAGNQAEASSKFTVKP
jgi:membrane carboxypeptidase/penicillin-binding protein